MNFRVGPGPVEPVHYRIVDYREYLTKIYETIKKNFQDNIDRAFDHVSKEIGFVVLTSIPFTLEIGDQGAVKSISVTDPKMTDTLYNRTIQGELEGMKKITIKDLPKGSYTLLFFWSKAFIAKFRTEWLEPAHFINFDRLRQPGLSSAIYKSEWKEPAHVFQGREWLEPAHWLNPQVTIPEEELALISAIDEVYPEFRLSDKIGNMRDLQRRLALIPEIREPAHFHPGNLFDSSQALGAINNLNRSLGKLRQLSSSTGSGYEDPAQREISNEISKITQSIENLTCRITGCSK